MKTVFLRALETEDKAAALREAIFDPAATQGRLRFEVDPESFASMPRSPFAYWVSDRVRRLFTELPPFEAEGRMAQRALSTNDDFRYLRLSWEQLADKAVARPASGWLPFAKGGEYSPYYADIHLVVKWIDEGHEIEADALRKFPYLRGNAEWVLHRECNYLRPGLTWPLRTNGLSFRVMPTGCIFGHKGPAAFVANGGTQELLAFAGLTNSTVFSTLVSLQLARTELAQSFEVGLIQQTPIPELTPADQAILASLARRAWSLNRSLDTRNETSHAFILPALLQKAGSEKPGVEDLHPETYPLSPVAWFERVRAVEAELSSIQSEIDTRCFDLYGIEEEDRRTIMEGFGREESDTTAEVEPDEENDPGDTEADGNDITSLVVELLSWSVGVAFGRFDVRLATGERALPAEPDPFDPLPICSPGMLAGADGLPLPAPPAGYPIAFPRDGVLVDDPGHARDLIASLREVWACVFGAEAETRWQEAAALLDERNRDVRTWWARNFFEFHLKRYSKSRRKAPLYWQLATPSGRYSVWLYYPCFTRDTLYTVLNDYATPKFQHEERKLTHLMQTAGPNPTASQRQEIAGQEAFVEELRVFRDEVARLAPLWNPHLDDGALITFAPLWRLVPQHRAWQKEGKDCWDKLAAGRYDWAHLAMHLWPERVVPQCAADRSLAIAHGLEASFWVEDEDGKWQPRQDAAESVARLVAERTSPAVKDTLQKLLRAPAPVGRAPRRRKDSRHA